MHQVPSDPTRLVILADFDSMTPETVFDYLTRPELLTQWWPKEAKVDLWVGGSYVFSWPANDWHVRGVYSVVEPGKRLAFTWLWDHDPDRAGEQLVDIWFEPLMDTGARLGLFQGEFHNTELGAADRQGTTEGWIHFLMRLAGLKDGNASG